MGLSALLPVIIYTLTLIQKIKFKHTNFYYTPICSSVKFPVYMIVYHSSHGCYIPYLLWHLLWSSPDLISNLQSLSLISSHLWCPSSLLSVILLFYSYIYVPSVISEHYCFHIIVQGFILSFVLLFYALFHLCV
jgi:hypothetical protein